MSHQEEKLPLLHSPNVAPVGNGSVPPHSQGPPPAYLFPTFGIGGGHPNNGHGQNYQIEGQPYNVVEVLPPNHNFGSGYGNSNVIVVERRTKSKGIASSAMLAIVALIVGLVLIFSFTGSRSGSNNSVQNVLKASAPEPNAPLRNLSQSAPETFTDITIPQGRLRGYQKLSREGREFTAFYKVPYAEAPLGNLRFRDPSPPSNWEGLRDNAVVAPQCIQKEKYAVVDTVSGEEDCLYANIYTPQLPTSGSSQLFPVMVYIHGGGFFNGNGSRYGPDYMLDEDVVLVTFQFRMGAFGWLNTGDDVIRGNMGAKDMIQMLRWVRDNIAFLNADPDLVTIFGNSGGGMFCGQLLLSPMSEGLFHRAIIQSGAPLAVFNLDPKGITEENRVNTLEGVASVVGCEAELELQDSQRLRECLVSKSAEELALASGYFNTSIQYYFTEEKGTGGEKFITGSQFPNRELLQGNPIMKVPIMIGNVNAEYYGEAAVMLKSRNITRFLNEYFEDVAREFLIGDTFTTEELTEVKQFYFGDQEITNNSLKNLGNLISDRQDVHPTYATARHYAKVAPTYLYWITKPPALSYIDKSSPGFPAQELGFVHHADELQYLFPYYGYPYIPQDDPEYFEYSKMLVKLWVRFARTGEATMDGLEWPKVNDYGNGFPNSTLWMDLGDRPGLFVGLQQRMGFWDQFDDIKLRYDWED